MDKKITGICSFNYVIITALQHRDSSDQCSLNTNWSPWIPGIDFFSKSLMHFSSYHFGLKKKKKSCGKSTRGDMR